eukprot:6032633-Prymnesium_polylepis.1
MPRCWGDKHKLTAEPTRVHGWNTASTVFSAGEFYYSRSAIETQIRAIGHDPKLFCIEVLILKNMQGVPPPFRPPR